VITFFRYEVAKKCAFVGYYTASSGILLPTFRDNLTCSRISRIGESSTLRMGRISCPEMSVRNYHYSLRNNPEERSSRIVSSQPIVLSRARSVQLNTIMRATSVEVRSMSRVRRIRLFLFNITDLTVGLCRLQELRVAGLSPRVPGFDRRPISVGFMSDKVALGQVFLRVILFSREPRWRSG